MARGKRAKQTRAAMRELGEARWANAPGPEGMLRVMKQDDQRRSGRQAERANERYEKRRSGRRS